MPDKHYIKFALEVVTDDIDRTPEESALTLEKLLNKTISETISDFYILTTVFYGKLEG